MEYNLNDAYRWFKRRYRTLANEIDVEDYYQFMQSAIIPIPDYIKGEQLKRQLEDLNATYLASRGYDPLMYDVFHMKWVVKSIAHTAYNAEIKKYSTLLKDDSWFKKIIKRIKNKI